MYFNDYSTSFQSLYKPMYNLQPGSAAVTPGMAGADTSAAAGAGAGLYSGYGMGGYNPIAQVGIGQFGPDQLVRNNEQKNNYYARPIAAHKVKDETPMILGIIGTALGTATLLLALRKGKKVTPAPVTNAVMGNNFAKAPYKAKSFKIDPNSIRYAGAKKGQTTPAGLLGASPINIPATIAQGNGSSIVKVPNNVTISGVPTRNKVTFAQGLRENAVDTPFEEIAGTTLSMNGQKALQGIQQNMPALATQPNLKPINEFLPRAEQNFVIQNAGLKGYLPTPQESILTKVNNNLNTIRPDMQRNGSIVYTTHTPETFANGYSIGANAKGADKLAALRAQLAQG